MEELGTLVIAEEGTVVEMEVEEEEDVKRFMMIECEWTKR
jgi:hypothetical protein